MQLHSILQLQVLLTSELKGALVAIIEIKNYEWPGFQTPN